MIGKPLRLRLVEWLRRLRWRREVDRLARRARAAEIDEAL